MDAMEESWPSGVCLQGPAPNHPERHWLKTVVASVGEKSSPRGTAGMDREGEHKRTTIQASKSMQDDTKTGSQNTFRDEPIGNLLTGWVVSGV